MTGAELRASILQAAVQGKLVPQDPTDEPASKLLERIREERRELVKQKKAKAPRGGDSVITRYPDGTVWEQRGTSASVEITDEIPFDIPEGWEWARVFDVCEAIVDCPHSTPKYLSEETGYVAIDTNCIDDNWHITGWRDLSEDAYVQRVARLVPHAGDLVFTREGSIGRSAILNRENVCLGQRVMIMRSMEQLAVRYLQIVLSSPSASVLYKASQKGTAARHINVRDVCAFLLPLPPLNEQQRIVAKLDELMPLVERYDKLDRERTELNAGIEDAMRASILQAAVQGQLTEREDGDEPASKLLERIREERRELVKQKRAKAPRGGESFITRYPDGTVWEQRGKGAAVEITDEVPFDIPEGWEWSRLGSLVLNRPQQVPSEPFNYLDISSIDNKRQCMSHGVNRIEADKAPSRARKPVEIGDVVYATVRPYLHNACVVDFRCELPMIASTGFAAFRAQQWLDSQYLLAVLISPFFDDYANDRENARGVAYPAINDARLYKALIPVPPLAEQQRIVAKLDELLPKTEKLGKLVS